MKKYVFLTEHLSGITGSERYVNNKCGFLRERGWEVIVFWNYNLSSVQLEHVKCFDRREYIHHELKFYPAWFSHSNRNHVLDRLASVVGPANQIVIESSKLELGAWGELLAQKIHGKHLCFILTEGIRIQNKSTFVFCYEKLKRQEFFTINKEAVQYLFSNFKRIASPENYFWSASQGVQVAEYPFPAFDNLPYADFTITSFGRWKSYFPYMVDEFRLFTLHHPDKSFNIFFIGDISDETEIRALLSNANIHLYIYPHGVEIIPKQLFTKSDVIVATAGCALLSAAHGCKTISMDVNRNLPLGLLYYTTLESNTSSETTGIVKPLSDWLNLLLFDKVQFDRIEDNSSLHSFDYQMEFIDNLDYHYFDSSKVLEPMTRHDWLYGFFVKIGLFRWVEFFYFKRRGIKVLRH